VQGAGGRASRGVSNTMVHVDLDAWIDKLRKCEHLEEDELKTLCEMVRGKGRGRGRERVRRLRRRGGLAFSHHTTHPFIPLSLFLSLSLSLLSSVPSQVKEILVEESNVQPVNSPVTVRVKWGD